MKDDHLKIAVRPVHEDGGLSSMAAEGLSSRICVKGLPKRCDERRLRQHFESRGSEVTDVRVMRTSDGKSRMFGFVGFRTPEQAEEARSYFSKSFIDTSRIEIELAKSRGHFELARPWSRHSKGSSAYARTHPDGAWTAGGDDDSDGVKSSRPVKPDAPRRVEEQKAKDAKLEEFLGLMQPNSKRQTRLWSNDDSAGAAAAGDAAAGAAAGAASGSAVGVASGEMELAGEASDEEYEEVDVTGAAAGGSGKGGGQGSGKGDGRVGAAGVGGGGGDVEGGEEEDPWAAEEVEVSRGLARWRGGGGADWLAAKKQGGMPGTEVGGSGRAGKGGEGEAKEEGEEGEEEEGAGGEEEEEGEGEDVEMGEEEGDEAGAAWEGEAGGEDGAAGLTDDLSGQENADQAQQQEDDGDMVGGLDEGRLFVRNLPYLATEPELRSLFGGYGRVDEILLPMDNETRRAKGYAHVTFSICEDAVRALAGLDGAIFQGRLMHVLPGKPRARMTGNGAGNGAGGWVGGEGDKGTSSFKRKREEEQKASAGSSHNWNPLFMRSDAVGEAMAERYGMDKREILDTEGGASLAVRLAQGETHLLAQTREWLATSGISVEALARLSRTDNKTSSDDKTSVERSATLLLVKNIDGKVSQRELSKLFGKYGQVASVLLAPGNALALVEFVEVGEAKRAFRSVAYSKLYGVPLFLEWAPVGLLDTAPAAKAAAKAAAAGAAASGRTGGVGGGAGNDTAAGEAEAAGEAKPEEEEEEGGEGRTLFVKNLNFKTTSEGLRALFTVNGWGVRSASVVTKRDPKQPDRMLSMGYGFVEFNTAAHAHDALRRMAGARIDEHRVQLKMSSRGTADGGAEARPARPAPAGGAAKASNKLLVRNVPFEASKAELRDLFSAFGQLKTLRIPKKFDGSHRGFAFVEFVSKAEAAKAMASLDGTHLYGRHLVLGYAKKEDTVEAMREKLRAQMGAAGGGKRQKKGGEGEEGGEEDPEALLDFDL